MRAARTADNESNGRLYRFLSTVRSTANRTHTAIHNLSRAEPSPSQERSRLHRRFSTRCLPPVLSSFHHRQLASTAVVRSNVTCRDAPVQPTCAQREVHVILKYVEKSFS